MIRMSKHLHMYSVLFVLLDLSVCVLGTGKLSLKLTSYSHPSGILLDGGCCDGVSTGPCNASTCDPYFVITIADTSGSGINIKFKTGTTREAKSIAFTDTIGHTTNPMNDSFAYWPGAATIVIDVKDNNTQKGPDGLIATLTTTYTHRMKTNNATIYNPVDPLTNNHTTILAEVNLRCDEGCNYDIYCWKCCFPMDNDTGHLICNIAGDLLCLPDWDGLPKAGCLIPKCTPPCQHGVCQVGQGSKHVCSCAPGFTGDRCQWPVTTALTTIPPPVTMAATTTMTTMSSTMTTKALSTTTTTTTTTQPTTTSITTTTTQPTTPTTTTTTQPTTPTTTTMTTTAQSTAPSTTATTTTTPTTTTITTTPTTQTTTTTTTKPLVPTTAARTTTTMIPTTTTTITTATTSSLPSTTSTTRTTNYVENDSGGCAFLWCYIFIPIICLLSLALLAIVIAIIVHYVQNRRKKAKQTKVEPFRSLDF